MRLKKKIRRIFNGIFLGLILAGVGMLLGFSNYEQSDQPCRSIHVKVDYPSPDTLITETDIRLMILDNMGLLNGVPLWQINIAEMKQGLEKNPYVARADIFTSATGIINIRIDQYQPILRVIPDGEFTYYLSREGKRLPVDPKYPVRILVASGAISQDSAHQASLYKMACYIAGDPFFCRQIEQIYVNPNGEYELVPKVGDHLVLFGNDNDIREKFTKLLRFYKKGLNQFGWNKYNIINIKFKNQVVCSKI